MLEGVSLQSQGNQRVDPRGLNATPRAVGLLTLDDPSLGSSQRGSADELDRVTLVEVQEYVERLKSTRPRAE